MTDETIAAAEPRKATRREWVGLAVIALPCLLYAMDLTVLNLALPRISSELRPSSAKLLWVVDIYGFFVAGLLITMGNLGDRIGRRRLLLIGAAAFGVASVAASMSRSAGTLIAARAVLGIAGATLAPSTLALIRNMFLDPRQRTVAIGVWISAYSVGGAIGPVLGGVMLQCFPWRSVFWLGVPVMVLLLIVGPLLLPEHRDRSARRLDLPSAGLSLAAMLMVTYAMKMLAQEGLGWVQLTSACLGLALGALFVRRQTRLADPLIDLRLFRAPAFGTALATYLLATLVTFGSYVMIGQYLQLVLGLSPLEAGLWMLPWSASYVVGSFLAPVIARRVRPAFVMSGGLLLAAFGFTAAIHAVTLGVGALVISSVMYSLGMSPVFTLSTDIIIGAAPPERAGAAAALSETSSELGGALGIAILGSIATAIYRGNLGRAALVAVPTAARALALDTLGGAGAAAAGLPTEAARALLLGAARTAFTGALQVTLAICAVVSLGAAIVVGAPVRDLRSRRRSAGAGSEAYRMLSARERRAPGMRG